MADTEKTYGTIVTDMGVHLMAMATLEGRKVNITQFAVGDGDGAYYQPNSSMLELKNEKWRGDVSSVSVNDQSSNMIDVVAVIPSNVGGWTIREMGIFDEFGNLVVICNTPDTEKVVITSGAAGEIELTMHVEISNAGVISLVIDPNVMYSTKKDLENHNSSNKAHDENFRKKADIIDLNSHANNINIHVNPETMKNYDIAISGLIGHTENTALHVSNEDKTAWTQGAQTAAQVADSVSTCLKKIIDLESRITRLEDALFNSVTGNPFITTFESLDGINRTKGVWNEKQKRLEC